MTLEQIIDKGTRGTDYKSTGVSNMVRCADGFHMSVIAGGGAYTIPRDCEGPYDAVEVGFPSARPEPWAVWERYCESPEAPTDTVYGFVPVAMVRDLVELHGGES